MPRSLRLLLLTAFLLTSCHKAEQATDPTPPTPQDVVVAQKTPSQPPHDVPGSCGQEIVRALVSDVLKPPVKAPNSDGFLVKSWTGIHLWMAQNSDGRKVIDFPNDSGRSRIAWTGDPKAQVNSADPADYVVTLPIDDLRVMQSLMNDMCGVGLKLPTIRTINQEASNYSVWVDTDGSRLFSQGDGRFESEHFLRRSFPTAMYRWQPMIDYALR